MNKNAARIIFLTLTFLLLPITSFTGWVQANPNPQETRGTVLYTSASGSGACTSWADACNLQSAITAAIATDEIWVKAGTYLPTNTTDRTKSFVLKNGVAIYGGFAGTETARDQRDWVSNPTILSGEIGVTGNTSDNSYHVLYGNALSAATILDGFTITSGNANGSTPLHRGGGMYNTTNSSPSLTNIIFTNNSANDCGGGIYNFDTSSPTLTNVTFSINSANYGGGMYNDNSSSPSLTNVTFSNNTATSGGGMINIENSNPSLTTVTFSNNSTSWNAGGMLNDSSSPTLTNVTFSGNTASNFGGGMLNYKSTPTLNRVTFSGNTASKEGGGMSNWFNSSPTLNNVTFSDNSARYGGGILNKENSSPTLDNVTFSNNSATRGGGMLNDYSSPTLTNLTFSGNTATNYGGGICNNHSNPTLINVTFSANSSDIDGGGMYNYNSSNFTMTNAILWGNTPEQVYYDESCTPVITYSDIQGGYSGTGNIDQDPLLGLLANNGGFTQTHALLAGSPAIDTGSPSVCPATDQRGYVRPIDGDDNGSLICDMGSIESSPEGTHGPVLYVSSGGIGACTSWEDTCTLQTALTTAIVTDEIWVEAGTYLPTETTDRTISFILKEGVAIYGGFAGTETALDQRDWEINLTILSGDIGVTGNTSDNCYHVVYGTALSTTTILDGFTITAGNADGSSFPSNIGGGMFNWENSNPTLTNIIFSYNSASIGGGMFNDSSHPTLTNVTFSENIASLDGGGVYNHNNSNPSITNVTFSANAASVWGGGMFNNLNSSPTLTNITFSDNTAISGGGMFNWENSDPTLDNVTFSSNSSSWNGGGMYNNNSSPTLNNITFSENTASNLGGGVFNYINSNPTLINVTIANNSAPSGGGISNVDNSNPTLINVILWGNLPNQVHNDSSIPVITYSDIQGGYAGIGNIDQDPLLDSLADNGGFTMTHALLPGSAAIDTGNPTICPANDQRGNVRPIDGDGDGTPECDIGAFEYKSKLIFVDKDAVGSNIGTSWASAFRDLQDALVDADPDSEIWVAEGTYKPTTTTDRTLSFVLKDSVAIYGGFAGTETARNQRNWTGNPTILSGDIGVIGFASDNSYNVVIGTALDTTTILDGFTITAGKADGSDPSHRGGGMYNTVNSSPTLTNIIFMNNSAKDGGGGMYNYNNSSPTLTNITFSGNTVILNGGGLYNLLNSNPTLINVTFSNNFANSGSGMLNDGSSPTLTTVTFSGNTADSKGGGLVNRDNSSPRLTNVTFSGNTASTDGGGIYNDNNSNPSLINVTFSGNSAGMRGGGLHNAYSNPSLINVTFSGNSVVGYGGGMYNYDGNPTLVNVTFSSNTATLDGGGMYNKFNSDTLLNYVSFSDNTATDEGGGLFNSGSDPTLTNVTFSNNSATDGGGMYNYSLSNPTMTNVTFSGNTAIKGGGMHNYNNCHPALTNATFYNNSAELGGGLYNDGNSNPTLTNVILWSNSIGQVFNDGTSTPTITYSDVQGGYAGTGNIDLDPLLGTLAANGGFTLTHALGAGSPAIDTGSPSICPATDQRGYSRPIDGDMNGSLICDIGAYEYDPFTYIFIPLIIR